MGINIAFSRGKKKDRERKHAHTLFDQESAETETTILVAATSQTVRGRRGSDRVRVKKGQSSNEEHRSGGSTRKPPGRKQPPGCIGGAETAERPQRDVPSANTYMHSPKKGAGGESTVHLRISPFPRTGFVENSECPCVIGSAAPRVRRPGNTMATNQTKPKKRANYM